MSERSSNPYQPLGPDRETDDSQPTHSMPEASGQRPLGRHPSDWALTAAVAHLLTLLAVVHLVWLLTWWSVGHPPRPMRDSADFFAAGVLAVVAWLLVVATPAVLLFSIAGEIMHGQIRQIEPLVRGIRLAVILLGYLVCHLYVRWDPLSVIDWWMD
ncbi:MAG: hypothetical protein HKN47_19660 [Pirellulaceae bacterium]|nr:hypothetical protein [Pirellulaceae bacterium]